MNRSSLFSVDLSPYSFVPCDLRNALWYLYLRIAAFACVFYLVSQGIVIYSLLITIEFDKYIEMLANIVIQYTASFLVKTHV